MTTAPLHIAAVGLGNVRFFRSPLAGPQQPWFSIEDLFRAGSIDRKLRRAFFSGMQKDYREETRMVETESGPTLIAPHWMGQGLIASWIQFGRVDRDFELAYTVGQAGAMTALTAHMSDMEGMRYAMQAYRNSNGIDEPKAGGVA